MAKTRLPSRRNHLTHKAKIGGKQGPHVRTIYLSVDAEPPNELWLRVKQHHLDAEKVAMFDIMAQHFSLMFKYHIPIEEICRPMLGVNVEPCGPVVDHPRIKMCSSVFDYIARHLLGTYAGRTDLFNVKPDEDKPL